jgi:lysophospholipase L1-like esterase
VVHVLTTIEHAGDFCLDGYHPGPEGYARWGAALGKVVSERVS